MKFLVIQGITSYGGNEIEHAFLVEANDSKEAIMLVGKEQLSGYFGNETAVKEGFGDDSPNEGWFYDGSGLLALEIKENRVTIDVENLLLLLNVEQEIFNVEV